MYGKGISREGSVLDIGVDLGIVKKSGAWYTYEGEQLGQGRENAKKFLHENPEIMVEISERIRGEAASGLRRARRRASMSTPTTSPSASTTDLPISAATTASRRRGRHRLAGCATSAACGMRGRSRHRRRTMVRGGCRRRRRIAVGPSVTSWWHASMEQSSRSRAKFEPELASRAPWRACIRQARHRRGAGRRRRRAQPGDQGGAPSPGATSPPAASTSCASRPSPTSRSTASAARRSACVIEDRHRRPIDERADPRRRARGVRRQRTRAQRRRTVRYDRSEPPPSTGGPDGALRTGVSSLSAVTEPRRRSSCAPSGAR